MNRPIAALALAGLAALTLGALPAHAEGFFDDVFRPGCSESRRIV
ncbi:hypothetical protein ACFPZ0_15495 [Streptomonospora nanhaiensis]|nr:hypothetical protein [Streptomonospora nanhaiensis]